MNAKDPHTPEERISLDKLVQSAAAAVEEFSEDELERYAADFETNMDKTNRIKFQEAYEKGLAEAIRLYPQNYCWADTSEAMITKVAGKMFDAMDRGTFNHDSKGFKIACKKLGIKSTRKAILEYWNDEKNYL